MKFEVVKTPEQRDAFNSVWTHVWALEGYDENRPEEIFSEYQQYDDFSLDYLFYESGNPIGTMRLVVQDLIDKQKSNLALPTFKDFDIEKEPDVDIEITLLTLLRDYRSSGAFFKIMEKMLRECRNSGFKKAVIAGHPRLVAMYRQLGMITREEPGVYYQGSLTIPAIITLDKAEIGIESLRKGTAT